MEDRYSRVRRVFGEDFEKRRLDFTLITFVLHIDIILLFQLFN